MRPDGDILSLSVWFNKAPFVKTNSVVVFSDVKNPWSNQSMLQSGSIISPLFGSRMTNSSSQSPTILVKSIVLIISIRSQHSFSSRMIDSSFAITDAFDWINRCSSAHLVIGSVSALEWLIHPLLSLALLIESIGIHQHISLSTQFQLLNNRFILYYNWCFWLNQSVLLSLA